jgi:hypothetical protein
MNTKIHLSDDEIKQAIMAWLKCRRQEEFGLVLLQRHDPHPNMQLYGLDQCYFTATVEVNEARK